MLGKAGGSDQDVLKDLNAAGFADLFPSVVSELDRSWKLLDKTYALEAAVPDLDKPLGDDPALNAFVRERLRRAALFTACLYLTAWERSADYQLPAWHHPPG